MSVLYMCRDCGKEFVRYNTIQTRCGVCTLARSQHPSQPRKPVQKIGKQTREWATFRDKVAIPYLDKKFGHVCSAAGCSETAHLDVDHIKTRGAHPELKYDVTNLRYLCRKHHLEVTGLPRWSKTS